MQQISDAINASLQRASEAIDACAAERAAELAQNIKQQTGGVVAPDDAAIAEIVGVMRAEMVRKYADDVESLTRAFRQRHSVREVY